MPLLENREADILLGIEMVSNSLFNAIITLEPIRNIEFYDKLIELFQFKKYSDFVIDTAIYSFMG